MSFIINQIPPKVPENCTQFFIPTFIYFIIVATSIILFVDGNYILTFWERMFSGKNVVVISSGYWSITKRFLIFGLHSSYVLLYGHCH